MNRALIAVIALGLAGIAAKPVHGTITAPLALTAEYWTKSPTSPPWCLSEDDFHERDWYGSYSGTVAATESFCMPYVDVYNGYDYFDGGGVGIEVVVFAVGTLTQLTLSGQDKWGTPYAQEAVLVGTQTIGHGRNAYVKNEYVACVFPAGQQNFQILSGTQAMTLSGDFSQVSVQLVAEMFTFSATNNYPAVCPEGQKPPGP
jgi:hypothetical protein